MRHFFYFFTLFFFVSSYSQTNTENYFHLIEPKIPLDIYDYESSSFNNADVLESVEYIDGFGTKLQKLFKKFNPQQKDLITFYEYDEFGREDKEYFPFYVDQSNLSFVPGAKEQQRIYYLTKFNDLTGFSQKVFDNSPLNRIMKMSRGGDVRQAIPGSLSDKTLKSEFLTNLANEVKLYTVNSSGQINNSLFYNKATLLKTIAKNENWTSDNLNTAQVFTDDAGRKIADVSFVLDNNYNVKKAITQYVYDSKGLLRYVLSPELNNYDFQSYFNSSTLKFYYKQFLLDPNVSGGGSDVLVTLNSNVLSVTFSAGFNSTPLKTGPIVYLDSRVPNANLGNIACTSCSGNYRLYTENGYLCIGVNTYPIATTGFTGTYSVNIGTTFSFNSSQSVLDKFAFQYKYDDFNRPIEQKTPGKGWEYSVFDQLDRPIITQDENLREQGLWLFTKYDVFGRVIYTGKFQSSLSRADLQLQLDNFYISNPTANNYEARLVSTIPVGGLNINYSNASFPTNISEVTSVSYYDDYDFVDADQPTMPGIVYGQNVTDKVQGLLTCNIKKTVGENTFTKVFNYYDGEARLIYSYNKNYLGGYTRVETKYNFRSKVENVKTIHKKDASVPSDIIIENRYTYDHAERLLGEYEKVNSQAEESLVRYVYDDIGNLVQKKIGGFTTATTPLQLVTYSHNILGWLTKINNPGNLGTNLFGLEIKYDNAGASNSIYNGSISQVQWKNSLPNTGLKTYNYTYDNLNRLKTAVYINSNNPTHNTSFFENVYYDLNGNITFLHRSGDVLSQANLEWMDYMTYKYDGNQLTKIDEQGHSYTGYSSYLTTGSALDTYQYDNNGNLIKDRNKAIDNIVYNDLNLIQEIQFANGNKVKFKYDASGVKLSKEFIVGSNSTVTQYIDGFQYLNGSLQFIKSSGGYVVNSGGIYKYVYIYGDHLGNNRLSYCDLNSDGAIANNEILSATDYYAYGMPHSGEFTSGFASAFLYKFQGKEFNDEGDLKLFDFGSRMFDPLLGRWTSTDPQNQCASPYVAFGNNPVLFTDPNGEVFGWDDLAVVIIGGGINVWANWDNIDSFGEGLKYFGVGAAAGMATYYTGGNVMVGGLVLGAGNNTLQQYKRNKGWKKFNTFELVSTTTISGATSYMGGRVGQHFSERIGGYLGSKIQSQIAVRYITTATASYGTGFTMGYTLSAAQGSTQQQAFNDAFTSANTALISSTLVFGFQNNKSYKPKDEVKAKALETEQTKLQKQFKDLDENIKNPKSDVVKNQKVAADAITLTDKQVQAKFKHAVDFGVEGNYNKANAVKFSQAINEHVNSPQTTVINGTYRGESVIHHLNPQTGINVITAPNGQFISGWKLNTLQLQNVVNRGSL